MLVIAALPPLRISIISTRATGPHMTSAKKMNGDSLIKARMASAMLIPHAHA